MAAKSATCQQFNIGRSADFKEGGGGVTVWDKFPIEFRHRTRTLSLEAVRRRVGDEVGGLKIRG